VEEEIVFSSSRRRGKKKGASSPPLYTPRERDREELIDFQHWREGEILI